MRKASDHLGYFIPTSRNQVSASIFRGTNQGSTLIQRIADEESATIGLFNEFTNVSKRRRAFRPIALIKSGSEFVEELHPSFVRRACRGVDGGHDRLHHVLGATFLKGPYSV
jgi:hypothetical protein